MNSVTNAIFILPQFIVIVATRVCCYDDINMITTPCNIILRTDGVNIVRKRIF